MNKEQLKEAIKYIEFENKLYEAAQAVKKECKINCYCEKIILNSKDHIIYTIVFIEPIQYNAVAKASVKFEFDKLTYGLSSGGPYINNFDNVIVDEVKYQEALFKIGMAIGYFSREFQNELIQMQHDICEGT